MKWEVERSGREVTLQTRSLRGDEVMNETWNRLRKVSER